MEVVRAFTKLGVAGTFRSLFRSRHAKIGALVGQDKYGNKYFENTKDYPWGQHRWVEYEGGKNFYENDASFVPPEWHGWLHHTTDDVPTERTTGSTFKTQPIANTCGSSAPYKRNLGGVINAFNPNLSQFRPRGWGVGNGLKGGSVPHEELYYTQPGFPLDKRNATRHISRGGRVGFTLTDTPASLAAKQAVRYGMTAAEHAKYADPSPTVTQVLALAESSAVEQGDAAAQKTIDGLVASQPELAAYDLPVEAGKRRLATYLTLGKGHARSWGKDVEAGTFAADVHEVLTAEEEAFLDASGGLTAEGLLLDVQKYQGMIDAYAGVTNNKAAAAGVERATEKRDAALAQLNMLVAINAKLDTLNAKYDAKAEASLKEEAAAAAQRPMA